MAASWFEFGGLRKPAGVANSFPFEVMMEEGGWQVLDLPRTTVPSGELTRAATRDASYPSALHGACQSGSIADVNEVLATMNGGELLTRKDSKLWTPLHYGSRGGRVEVVKALVEAARVHLSFDEFKDFLNSKDYKQQTPLYKAGKMGHASVVEHLLVAGADLSVDPEMGIPVLHVAADRQHVAVVDIFLNVCEDYALSERDTYGRTLLHVAARRGLVELVKRLQDNFEEKLDVNAMARKCVTPLHLAVYCGHLELVKLLLAWPGISWEAQTEERFTALHMAADGGHAQILQMLVGAAGGSCINAETCVGRTPLHYACRRGDASVVKNLLSVEGIDVNVQDCVRSFTPLHLAAARGHSEAVKLLLQNKRCPPDTECKIGPPQDRVKGEDLKRRAELIDVLPGPRLVDSLDNRWTEEVDWLERFKGEHSTFFVSSKEKSLFIEFYQLGHEITSLGKVSWTQYEVLCYRQESTALHLAAQNGHLEAVTELLAHPSTNVNATDMGGRTPLHFAAAKGHLDVLKALVAHPGIHLNAVTLGGPGMLYPCETPLHLAVHMERLEVVAELCAQPRVRGNRKNWQNKTPLDIAWEKPGDSAADEIRELLMKQEDVQKYVENLFKDRDLFQNAANALLVGGTMIASITFTGILQPPMQSADQSTGQSNSEAPADKVARLFLISNSLSFAFAILTVSSAIHMLLPIVRFKQEPFIADGVIKIRRRVAFTSFVFTIAIIFVLVAYFQACYSLMSTRVQEWHNAMLIVVTSIFLIPIMLSLVKDYIFFLHENILEFWLSDSLRTLSETLHYQSPFLRPLYYHLIFAASLVGSVVSLYMFFQQR